VGESPVILEDERRDILLPGTLLDSFKVMTEQPCVCKTDTSDVPYQYMQYDLEGEGTSQHNFSFSVETDVPYSWKIKCAPVSDTTNPYLIGAEYNTRQLRDFHPDYPSIYSIFNWWSDDLEYLSRYDVVVTSYAPKSEMFKARSINPNLKMLKIYPFAYGQENEELFRETSNDTTHALYNCLICDSQDSILEEEFWKHPMYNLANPACVDFISSQILQRWKDDLLMYDGIFFDRVHGGVSWMFDDMDLDRDGIADDSYKIDSAWNAGVKRLLTNLRAAAPNTPIVGNSATLDYTTWLSGKWFEVFLSFYLEGWWNDYDERIEEYIDWSDQHCEPWDMSMIAMGGSRDCFVYEDAYICPESVLEETRTNYQTMRFGLASTLMGNGLYLYDIESPVWGQLWWYDEYDVSLGQPVDDAQHGEIWQREFENGIALVNPYYDTAHITFDRTFWAIAGTQDPIINNGQALTELYLPPKDGRILLKNNPVNSLSEQSQVIGDLKVFPNPAEDHIMVQSSESGVLTFYNVLGRKVLMVPISEFESRISVETLTRGNYILELRSSSGIQTTFLHLR
jgi:hypothetical protein